jgi:IS30 family transposase
LNWSPEQIAGWLKRAYPEDEHSQVSHETIYRSLSTKWRASSMNGRARLWASKPQPNDLMLVLHRPLEPALTFWTHSSRRLFVNA